jgi:hypothetical protein
MGILRLRNMGETSTAMGIISTEVGLICDKAHGSPWALLRQEAD